MGPHAFHNAKLNENKSGFESEAVFTCVDAKRLQDLHKDTKPDRKSHRGVENTHEVESKLWHELAIAACLACDVDAKLKTKQNSLQLCPDPDVMFTSVSVSVWSAGMRVCSREHDGHRAALNVTSQGI